MQRNSTSYRSLSEVFFTFAALILYSALSTIYPYLPPLFGFMIALLVTTDKKYLFPVLIFLLFFEAEHNHIIFTSWIFAFLYIRFILPVLINILVCRRCIIFISVALAYILFYAQTYLISFILGDTFIEIDNVLLGTYIVAEMLLAMLLL